MPGRIKQTPACAVLLALLLAVAGCGGGASGSGSGSDGSDSAGGSGSGSSGGVAQAPELEKTSSEDQAKLEWSQSKQADAYNLYYATKGNIEPGIS